MSTEHNLNTPLDQKRRDGVVALAAFIAHIETSMAKVILEEVFGPLECMTFAELRASDEVLPALRRAVDRVRQTTPNLRVSEMACPNIVTVLSLVAPDTLVCECGRIGLTKETGIWRPIPNRGACPADGCHKVLLVEVQQTTRLCPWNGRTDLPLTQEWTRELNGQSLAVPLPNSEAATREFLVNFGGLIPTTTAEHYGQKAGGLDWLVNALWATGMFPNERDCVAALAGRSSTMVCEQDLVSAASAAAAAKKAWRGLVRGGEVAGGTPEVPEVRSWIPNAKLWIRARAALNSAPAGTANFKIRSAYLQLQQSMAARGEYEILNNKLAYMHQAWVSEGSPLQKLQLEHHLQETIDLFKDLEVRVATHLEKMGR